MDKSYSDKIAIIFNSASGTGSAEKKLRKIKETFRQYDLTPDIFLVDHSYEKIQTTIQNVITLGYGTVIAAGGDGTIGTVAAELVGTDIVYGVIPTGTFNLFAKFIGVPSIESAVRAIVKGVKTLIDVGEVNGHIFLNNSTLGFHADLVAKRETLESRGYRKWPAYIWAMCSTLKQFRVMANCYRTGMTDFCQRTPFIFIGNNEYPFAFYRQNNLSHIQDGKLRFFHVSTSSRIGFARQFFEFIAGTLRHDPKAKYSYTGHLTITSDAERLPVSLDGEIRELYTPLYYRIRPSSLRILLPYKPTGII